jgi:HSP20 family molecular chaperone IbpA
MSKRQHQSVPVCIYQGENQIGMALPIAGLEPEDITVSIDGKRVTISGRERGPRQHGLDLLTAEWTIGPYYREVDLPDNVDGSLANATYGNGVLALTLPKTTSGQNGMRTEFTLEAIQATRGERVGHTGHDIRRMTTKQHLEAVAKLQGRIA